MNDFLSLLPLIIVCSGAILLMLLAALEKARLEVAASLCMGFFAVAFFIRTADLLPTGNASFYRYLQRHVGGEQFYLSLPDWLSSPADFFTAMTTHSYFKVNSFSSLEFYAIMMFGACGMLLLTPFPRAYHRLHFAGNHVPGHLHSCRMTV